MKEEAEETVMMKKVMAATDETVIGYATFNFVIPHDGGRGGPTFVTRKQNPREATTDSLRKLRKELDQTMAGLVRDRPEFAVFLGVKLEWIANLDEIQGYKGGKLPQIIWTEEGEEGVADLFNGNHQFLLLLQEVEAHMKQWKECVERRGHFKTLSKPTKAQKQQNERDTELSRELLDILRETGTFSVKLFDLGEWFQNVKLYRLRFT